MKLQGASRLDSGTRNNLANVNYFITATDTGAGKTYVTCLLLAALARMGKRAAGFKPFCCGDRDDAFRLQKASGGSLTIDQINPFWFKVPTAPFVAARIEHREVDLNVALSAFAGLADSHDCVLVEGAGGWEVPLVVGATMADFAASLALPVVVVVDNRLGALNHTLLTIQNIHARGLECAGIILNHVKDQRDPASISNRAVIESFANVPVLAEVQHGETEIEWPL